MKKPHYVMLRVNKGDQSLMVSFHWILAENPREAGEMARDLVDSKVGADCSHVMVSNEVGLGNRNEEDPMRYDPRPGWRS